jgi:hypothetical protein
LTAVKRRNRIVVFRLTEDEYEFLRGACHTAGGRNLSDFTRSEVLTRLASAPEIANFSALDQRLEEMQAQLQSVLALLETTVRYDALERRLDR